MARKLSARYGSRSAPEGRASSAPRRAGRTRPAEPLVSHLGTTLGRIRAAQGLSLDELAKASGVSRAMLSQIEHDQSVPTVNLLWKIAKTLGVPFVELLSTDDASPTFVLRAGEGRRVRSSRGGMTLRPLSPVSGPRQVEFRELRLDPLAEESSDPHPAGAVENLVLASGTLEVTVGAARQLLRAGDAIFFAADVPHGYRNPANVECLAYVVIGHAPQK